MERRSRTGLLDAAAASRVESRALWLLLAVGVLLMIAATASGEERGETATRTERIRAVPAAGQTVRVQNVNGDVAASGGAAFSAAVTISVGAPTRERAEEILEKTRVVQTQEGSEFRIETEWPSELVNRGRDRIRKRSLCRECRITARYELTLPPGTPARLETVNGEVRVKNVDGALNLHTVNGNVLVIGAKRALRAQTVNGRLDAAAAALPAGIAWDLQTVNGAVLATLPKDAQFVWTASTMSGGIASTFALPVRGEDAATAPPAAPASPAPPGAPAKAPRARAIVVEGGDSEDVIDVTELSREIEESLRDVEIVTREHPHAMRQIRVQLPQRSYTGTLGGGGATLRTNTLNGNITLLAAGTREAEAKSLVAGSRAIVVTVPRVAVPVPRVHVRVPRVQVQPPDPLAELDPLEGEEDEEVEVVRGDVAGDFLSTSNGSYRLGHVAGRVKVLTHSGEIHLASAGKGADLKTFGGNIRLGPIRGDLKAQTLAGDIRATEVTGSAVVETSGGDIRIERVGGAVNARTDGGDVVLPAVTGAVAVETGGGEVRVGLLSRSVKGGVLIENAGGDVLLTLPADFQADVDLHVEGAADPEDVLIRSDFPGIAVTRGADAQRATGSLNGGGPRLTVKTSSGSIRLRKGPAAGS